MEMSMDTQHGHAARTCSTDMQQEHEAWTHSMDTPAWKHSMDRAQLRLGGFKILRLRNIKRRSVLIFQFSVPYRFALLFSLCFASFRFAFFALFYFVSFRFASEICFFTSKRNYQNKPLSFASKRKEFRFRFASTDTKSAT
jgi:hypothetical protein